MLNEALRLLRVYHDLSQTELAHRLGVSKSWVSEIEKGVKSPTLSLLQSYADVFDMPLSSILFFSEQMERDDFGERVRVGVAKKVVALLGFIAASKEGAADVKVAGDASS